MNTERDYVTLDDVAKEVGMKKTSLYYYLRALKVKTEKFPLNRHAFISRADADRVKEAIESPWKIKELGASTEDQRPAVLARKQRVA